jgi:acyl carrier protein
MPVLLETGIPASLSTIVLGGEAIEATEFATWLERYPGAALHNLYGITEATVHTTVKTLTEAALAAGVASPIGRPLPGVQLAVIRDDGGLAVPGDEGELMIGGAGVAQGYLNRPELTAGRFVTQNLPGHSADRWYRTGDRAFELPNGEFAYRGRLDRQVKLRGYRIELGEIEAALLRHPGIAAAAVEMDEPAGHSLVAYIVAAGQAAGPRRDEELREHLRGTLPDYMIPRVFMALPAMPLTANGKVDVARLPPTGPPAGPAGAAAERPLAGQPTGAGGAGPEDRPRPGTETIVATIWQASLGTAIRRSDSFFAKGGDSMSALEVVAAVDALGLPASVQGLYAAPRLADFAASLEQQPVGVPAPDDDWHHFRLAAGAQVPSSATDAYPITRTQLGLLYEGSRSPLTPLYHVTSGVHLVGLVPAAVDDFPGAVQSVARAHPALRTGMQLHRAGGHQIVYSSVDVRTTAIDVRGEREERQRAAFERWLKDKAGEPFDPEDVPLWRVAFFRTGDDRGYLGVVHHHAILDGWSVAVLFREFLSVLSGGQCDGEPAYALPRFAALEAAAAESAVSKRFWSDVVSRCRSSHDAPCRPSDGAKEHRITVTLHGQLRASLKATADSAGWWLKSVLLAAHITALRVIDPHTNATLMVASGRPEIPDAENVLGVFLNNLPFPVPSDSATTYAQLILHCMRQEADFSAHRRFPYADMPRSAGNQPLWSMFNFVDFTAVGLDEYRDRLPDNNRTDVPVTVSVTETALVVEVRCDGRAEELAEKFADGFLAALGQIVQDPHVSVMAGGEPGRVSADAVSREAPEDEPFRLPRGAVVPPATATEALLVDVWQRLLGMEVGTTDNFFAIGGDSLMALKVIALVREQTGFRLPVSAFVGDQDLASIAKILAENSQLAGR